MRATSARSSPECFARWTRSIGTVSALPLPTRWSSTTPLIVRRFDVAPADGGVACQLAGLAPRLRCNSASDRASGHCEPRCRASNRRGARSRLSLHERRARRRNVDRCGALFSRIQSDWRLLQDQLFEASDLLSGRQSRVAVDCAKTRSLGAAKDRMMGLNVAFRRGRGEAGPQRPVTAREGAPVLVKPFEFQKSSSPGLGGTGADL